MCIRDSILLDGGQGVDEGDGAAGLKVDAGVVAGAAVADVLALFEAVGLQPVSYTHLPRRRCR